VEVSAFAVLETRNILQLARQRFHVRISITRFSSMTKENRQYEAHRADPSIRYSRDELIQIQFSPLVISPVAIPADTFKIRCVIVAFQEGPLRARDAFAKRFCSSM
jgi:hypothetical protein